jgi:hypothetical protein
VIEVTVREVGGTEPPPGPRSDPSSMSQGQKDALTMQALGLLTEQVQARIVHYKGDLETSPELDAVTAQVVAQLKAMQAAVLADGKAREPPEGIEKKHTRTLAALLSRVFAQQGHSSFLAQNLKPIGRRIAKLFFESELHAKTRGDKDKVIHHPEQGVCYVLQRYTNRIRAELEGFEYASDEVRQLTFDTLGKIERDLQVTFLSRRSPELNRVMQVYTSVLASFLHEHLPPRLEQMAKFTIHAARTAHHPQAVSYKVIPECFPAFRSEWERVLMQQMVHYCGDELLARLKTSREEVREETIKFFTDPHIFSETGDVLCDALYDYLCLEGFLDLPMDWRVQHARDS